MGVEGLARLRTMVDVDARGDGVRASARVEERSGRRIRVILSRSCEES